MNISPGTHKARAVEGDFGVAGTGTRQIAVLFELTDGDHKGSRITWYGFFTPSTAERTVESLRHCGCPFVGDDLGNLDGLTTNEVALVCEEDGVDENGNPRVRVRWVNRLSGGVALGARMTPAERRSFADEMRGYVLASRQGKGGGQQPVTPAARPAPPVTTNGTRPPAPPARRSMKDDDIPY